MAINPDTLFVKKPCFITGRLVPDTDRERIRQKLAQYLVDDLGYRISDFVLDREIPIEIKGSKVIAHVDMSVVIDDRYLMILRGGPGSVVTREAGTVSAARLLVPDYIVPWAVQANLFDAAFIDVKKKRAAAYGWDAVPSRKKLLELTSTWPHRNFRRTVSPLSARSCTPTTPTGDRTDSRRHQVMSWFAGKGRTRVLDKGYRVEGLMCHEPVTRFAAAV